MDRAAVIVGWAESILAGRWDNITRRADALAHARLTADALPGLFRTDVIELEASPCR